MNIKLDVPSHCQICGAFPLCVLGKLRLVHAHEPPFCDGDDTVDDGVIDRGPQTDRREHRARVIAAADELQPPVVDQEEVTAFANLERADILAAQQRCAAARRDLQKVISARRGLAGIQPVQQERHAQLF